MPADQADTAIIALNRLFEGTAVQCGAGKCWLLTVDKIQNIVLQLLQQRRWLTFYIGFDIHHIIGLSGGRFMHQG